MRNLMIKFGAAGDVVRTTTLLHFLEGETVWLTGRQNRGLLEGIDRIAAVFDETQAHELKEQRFDLVVNLEDSAEAANVLEQVHYDQLFGAFLSGGGKLGYTGDSSEWFDMSLISRFGKDKADQLKLQNRRSYQEIIFEGLKQKFNGQPYFLPAGAKTDLKGDVALAPKAGTVWPAKNWAYFDQLAESLRADGFSVNVLPHRKTLVEHLGDIQNHAFLVSGDSLPMHLALGSKIHCLTIFNCTSPWEIFDYGIQTKMVSPLLEEFFYRRDYDERAATSIPLHEVQEEARKILSSLQPVRT